MLVRADGTAGKFAVNALAGTFRFLTGNSEKSAYQIITPTGTLGVRGTKFDFTVDPRTGQTKVVLFEGQVKAVIELASLSHFTELQIASIQG